MPHTGRTLDRRISVERVVVWHAVRRLINEYRRQHEWPSSAPVAEFSTSTRATGLAFFGSLGDRAHAIMNQFSDQGLQVIAAFITAMADSAHHQVQNLEG
jgi:hypothetical protein